jgi:hypothetical protein
MLKIEGNQISYELSNLEKLGALSSSPYANKSNLISVERVENPWTKEVLRGMRAPGTGIPYIIMLGTMRYKSGKDFCVVYKRRPVLVLEFKNEKYQRWIIPATSNNLALVQAKIGDK